MNSRLLSRSFSRSLSSLIDAVPGGGFSFLNYDPLILIDYDYAALKAGGDPAELYDPVATLLNEGIASDAAQTTALNQGSYLKHDGRNFFYFSAIGNNNIQFDSTIFPDGTDDDFEFTCVFNMEEIRPTQAIIFAQRSVNVEGAMVLSVLDSGKPRFLLHNGSGYVGISSATVLSANVEYEMKLTRVGDLFTLYIDGVSAGSYTSLSGNPTITGITDLGHTVNTNQFKGAMYSAQCVHGGSTHGVDFAEMTHDQESYVTPGGALLDNFSTGDQPSKLIGYSCIRHNGVNTYYTGTFPEDLAGGHLFVVFDVLNGPSPYNDRVFSAGRTGYSDTAGESSPMALSLGGKFAAYTSAQNLSHTAAFNGRAIQSVKIRDGLLSTNVNGEALSATPALPSLQFQSWAIGSEFSGGGDSKPPMDVLFVMFVDKDLSANDEATILSELNTRFEVY